MSKSKKQKREEALLRQQKHLITTVIPAWSRYFGSGKQHRDEESDNIYENNLVRSAHAAHCDRHGNFLDVRFYKHIDGYPYDPDPFECALKGKIYSIEEMKATANQRNGLDKGLTLYRIAYGAPL